MRTLKQQAATGIRWTGTAAAVTVGLQLILIGYLGHRLTPTDFGLIAIIQATIAFFLIFTETTFQHLIIQKQNLSSVEYSSLYWLNIVVAIVGAAILIILSPFVADAFSMDGLSEAMPFVGAILLIGSTTNAFDAYFQKNINFAINAKSQIINSGAVLCVTIITLSYLGYGVEGYLWGLIAGFALRSVYLGYYGKRKNLLPRGYPRISCVNKYVDFLLYRSGAMLSNYVSYFSDQILIAYFLGPAAAGLYNVGHSLIVRPVRLLNPIFLRVSFPIFSSLQKEEDRLRSGFLKMLNFLTVVQAPALVGIAVLAEPIIYFYLGEKWIEASAVVQILCLYALARSIVSAVGSLLIAKGLAKLTFYWDTVLAVIVPLVISVTAISTESVLHIGASLCALQLIIMCAQYYFILRPTMNLRFFTYLNAFVVPLCLAALMGGVVHFYMANFYLRHSVGELLAMIALGSMVYCVSFFVCCRGRALEMYKALVG